MPIFLVDIITFCTMVLIIAGIRSCMHYKKGQKLNSYIFDLDIIFLSFANVILSRYSFNIVIVITGSVIAAFIGLIVDKKINKETRI